MPLPTAKLAQKRAKLRAKLDGTAVTLHWQEWLNGEPTRDATTGAVIGSSAVERTASVRAFVHFANPTTSGYRKFAEVEVGDAIVDFPLDLLRITDAGDTALAVNEIVDELAYSAANRLLDAEDDPATGESVEPFELENLSVVFGGHTWVQKEIGEELARNWDTLYAGLDINRSLLLRKG